MDRSIDLAVQHIFQASLVVEMTKRIKFACIKEEKKTLLKKQKRRSNCPVLSLSKLICTLKTAQLTILITITHAVNTILIFDVVSKAVIGAIILFISLPYWLLGLPLPCKEHQ